MKKTKYVYVGSYGNTRFFAEVELDDEDVEKAQTENAVDKFGELCLAITENPKHIN